MEINDKVSDKELYELIEKANPKLIPPSWKDDDTLPGKTFSKVRALFAKTRSTATSRH